MEEKTRKNYDFEMQSVIDGLQGRAKLLLHSCCAPCSSACLERLSAPFETTVFYYNPNIDDEEEYEKRKKEQIRFLKETGFADFLDCDHEKEEFFRIAEGLESEPERGKRCYLCYKLRLEKTAAEAAKGGYEYFCTTLSLSPYKNAVWINELGEELAEKYGVKFLPSDFKKKGGYPRSLALSKEYGLYRQDYCGCKFSKAENEKRREEQRAKNQEK